uniref:acyl carrier protein n=1 Tax=Herbidospora sakaeratensis TaxID=564415 RepID=UPI0007859FD2|nr:methoxymalonate biosynthesis protein [Herbidospora sakaeratensis]
MTDRTTTLTAEDLEKELAAYLSEKTKTEVGPADDVFASGLVSSMFAMQLVVHLESTYDVAIIGPELKIDNFRTAQVMAALVLRLSDEAGDA